MSQNPWDEARTRRELIDPRLRLAGWDPGDPSLVLQELELRLRGVETQDLGQPPEARGFTDYALVRHGVPVAVVEAKKTAKNVEIGRQQALGYSESLQALHGGAGVEPEAYWTTLRPEDLDFLRSTIAPILRARSAADPKGLLFEIEIVEAGTAALRADATAFEAVRESLVAQIAELPLTVNLVAREQDVIRRALEDAFWIAPSDGALRDLSHRLAPLMRFRQRRPEPPMKLDLADAVAVKETIEFGPEHERLTTAAYRKEVEEFVRGLAEGNAVLRKVREGAPLSDSELHEVAQLLAEGRPWVTADLLRKVYDHKSAHLVQLLRHVLGVERLPSWKETVTCAFDAFIAEHNTFTSLQIRFLQTLRTFVLQTGRVEKGDLVAPPFTQLHRQGVRGVFRPEEIEEILRLGRGLVA